MVGQVAQCSVIQPKKVDLVIAVPLALEGDLPTVRRPAWVVVRSPVGRKPPQLPGLAKPEIAVVATARAEQQRAAMRRPGVRVACRAEAVIGDGGSRLAVGVCLNPVAELVRSAQDGEKLELTLATSIALGETPPVTASFSRSGGYAADAVEVPETQDVCLAVPAVEGLALIEAVLTKDIVPVPNELTLKVPAITMPVCRAVRKTSFPAVASQRSNRTEMPCPARRAGGASRYQGGESHTCSDLLLHAGHAPKIVPYRVNCTV